MWLTAFPPPPPTPITFIIWGFPVGKPKSIKSFKWLTDVDTSAIETKTIKETVENIKQSVNEDVTNTIQAVSDAVQNSKEQWNITKDQLKNSAEELKNLFNFKKEEKP